MPTGLLLEVAVDSLERAKAAERGGAHRLELCANLELGGLTPHIELIRKVRSAVRIPIHVMVRPRPGDFVYSAEEFAEMRESIKEIKGENVQGIVTGVLLPNGSIDGQRTCELVALASPMQVTFHRAFDETKDLAATLEDIVLTGAHRILTSGGAADAPSGVSVLRSLIQQAGNRITILPGGGLHVQRRLESGSHLMHCMRGIRTAYRNCDFVAVANPQRHDRGHAARVRRSAMRENRHLRR